MGESENSKSILTHLFSCYRSSLWLTARLVSLISVTSWSGGLYLMDSSPAPNQKHKLGSIIGLWGLLKHLQGCASRGWTLLLLSLSLVGTGVVHPWAHCCVLGHREQTGACLLRAWPSSHQNPQESLHLLLRVLDQALRHLVSLYSCNSPHPPTLPFSFYSAWRQCARRCAILPVNCWFKLPSPSSVL